MVRTVTWISDSDLACEPTANVILCMVGFTIPAQLTDVFTNSCPNEFAYTFTYEDEDLPDSYLDNYGPLGDEDIQQVLCEDCWTQWAKQLVDKAFQFVVTPGDSEAGDDLVLPSAGPLEVNGGNGIDIALIQPNQLWIGFDPSSDEDNQIILGSDNNPYVAPSLFSPTGWYTLEEGVTWAYASAQTITVPSGAASRFAKGDKLKITQLGVDKYLYIIGVADTLLTVHAGSVYTISNNPIEAAYLSKDLSPVGFPSSFAFTSTIAGFSVLPTQTQIFSIIGRKVRIDVASSAPGTSNSTAFNMTTPITAEAGGPKFISGGNQGYDNSVYQESVLAEIGAGDTVIYLSRDGGTLLWTAAGDKSAAFNLEYYF